jgi:PAS domain S-box-containing protein
LPCSTLAFGSKIGARTPLLFAIVSISGASVLVSAAGIHASATVAGAQRFVELRGLTALVFSIAQLWLYADLSASRARWFLWTVTGFLSAIFLISGAGYPLNGHVIAVAPRVLPWGDTLWFPIRQQPGWWGWPIYTVALTVPAFAVVAGSGLRHRDRAGGTLLAVTGFAGFFIYLSAAVVDVLRLPVPFPAVFSVWLYMVFAVVLVSREYRQRNVRIAASESRQAAVFNASNDAIFALDEQCRIVTLNPAAVRLVGCGQNRCVPICAEQARCGLMQLLQRLTGDVKPTGSASLHTDTLVARSDGTQVPVEAVVQLLTEDSQITWLVTLRDRRERLQQEQERRQLEQLSSLGLLAGGVAHDFRNVLTGVIGVSELMRAKTQNYDLQGYADMLAQCGAQATELCEDFKLTISDTAVHDQSEQRHGPWPCQRTIRHQGSSRRRRRNERARARH